jgi:hypothetical protein
MFISGLKLPRVPGEFCGERRREIRETWSMGPQYSQSAHISIYGDFIMNSYLPPVQFANSKSEPDNIFLSIH